MSELKSKIIVMRHGDRNDYHNPLYWIFGYCITRWDTELSSYGIENSKKVGKELSESITPTHIITSPWLRCIQTATIIKNYFPNSELIVEPLLGEYEKKIEYCTLYPEGRTEYKDMFQRPENENTIKDRAQFIKKKLASKYPHSIWITHQRVMKEILSSVVNKEITKYLGYLSYSVISDNEITEPTPGFIDMACWLNKKWNYLE